MSAPALSVISTGLVTPVGLSAPRACAALRAKIANPSETAFLNGDGKRLRAHQVPLPTPWRGHRKLVAMAASAVHEALEPFPDIDTTKLPVLLCLAELARPGRDADLDGTVFSELEAVSDLQFHATLSQILPQGKVGPLVALTEARRLLGAGVENVLIVAVDSLLVGSTLSALRDQQRLLNAINSNGFMPGEAAGALLVGKQVRGLQCLGIGTATEAASFHSEEPLRAEGLTQAIRAALTEAGLSLAQVGYRISTLNGEQYWFKELDLACSRLLRGRHEFMDLWHPAECVGDAGAALGAVCMSVAFSAAQKGYAAGDPVLVTSSNEDGACVAAIFSSAGAA